MNDSAAGIVGAPVWDTQSRYMHDEDSACGLWVQNEEGQEWIAYGDKQLFDGHCRINRVRWWAPHLSLLVSWLNII